MEALLSIPMLSIFLVPVLSSYSTSLNLLFFYMTWSTLVLSHSRLRVELFGTIAVRVLFFALPSLIFFLFDILTPSAAIHIKAYGATGLPGGKRRRRIRAKELKVAAWALFNLCLGIAMQGLLETLLVQTLGKRSALKVSMKLPMPFEFLTYVLHRYALHSRWSPMLARWHRAWFHSLPAPFPLSAHYDHPITYLITKFVPTYAPAIIFRFHMLTYLLYLLLISIEETFAYSGYTVMPTNFFLGGIARRMDMHSLMGARGNFGPWGIMDWIFGTAIRDSSSDGPSSDESDEPQDMRKAYEAARRKAASSSSKGRGPGRR
ncbi:Fatty acid hydroxylase [Penicillium griseofulvum]|uniref:Fatty acid hydroxylase n=1 Tax=Penicillium patulum TaxID=5078 RepID=A0A135LD47_PENPA|nr:Fatty acid hydroxylase [Penicillium griseofulvum]KXG46893.1 Fatty acid hydroxylase [Penicillium griseofulvum]